MVFGWYLMVFLMIISMVFDGDDPIFLPSSNFSMPRGFRFVQVVKPGSSSKGSGVLCDLAGGPYLI